MKRLIAVALGVLLSTSLIASANAAPKKSSTIPKQPQGLINAKKVMQYRIEREKKMIEVRKKAQAKKHQAQGV